MSKRFELCDRCDGVISGRALDTALGVFGKNHAGENVCRLFCKACVDQTLLIGSCWPPNSSSNPYVNLARSAATAKIIGELSDFSSIMFFETGREFLNEDWTG
jgi:hypothetical protein